MSRTVGSSGPRTEEAIRKAGLRLIYEHGYEAMTLRDLAKTVGVQSGSLYRYFPSKQDLLMDLLSSNMREMLLQWDEVSADVHGAVERLRRFVAFHIDYHTARRREVFICSMELRSLEPANYKKVVELRRRYERQLVEIFELGVEAGSFDIKDPQIAAFGVLAMLTGVCAWYQPSGRLAKDELIDTYMQLICHGLMNAQPIETGASTRSASGVSPLVLPPRRRVVANAG